MKRLSLLLAVLALAGCENKLPGERPPAAEAAPRPAPLPAGVERVKIGACWYVIARGEAQWSGTGNPGIAIVHAGDCPNHDWSAASVNRTIEKTPAH
jgi:predicted small lipoprotein YifL